MFEITCRVNICIVCAYFSNDLKLRSKFFTVEDASETFGAMKDKV